MYKTIRHGENSLQYTILPQNDDFRIEGKLPGASRGPRASSSSAATMSASATSSNAHKRVAAAPRKRRTFFAYLGLVFVCTVIIGAVLIPFLVSAECLPSPTEWFLKTKAALTHSVTAPTQEKPRNVVMPTAAPAAAAAAALLGAASVGKSVQIVNHNGVEQFVLKLNKSATTTTSSTTTMPIMTTSSMTATNAQQEQQDYMMQPPPSQLVTVASTALPTTTLPSTPAAQLPPLSNRLPIASTITTRIIQVPLLKSAAKKPIMPPVLAKTPNARLEQHAASFDNLNTAGLQNNKSNDWMNMHWPFIDPSTYFQWTGYKSEDSVLLPALLGFALIGMILIITVCLVARNKRTIVSSVRKRNRNDIEEQGAEDNATLLTTTNLSDDD